MNTYKELEKQEFAEGKWSIVPIRYDDRFLIMKWRNEQVYHLRQNRPLTEKDQEEYFSNTIVQLFEQDQPSQLLFSYLENGICVGYGGLVHINRVDKHAEISFIMNTELEQEFFQEHWCTFLRLVEQIGFGELRLHKMYTYAYDIRPLLYKPLEEMGYKKDAVLEDHCLFKGGYKDVIIHSKINQL